MEEVDRKASVYKAIVLMLIAQISTSFLQLLIKLIFEQNETITGNQVLFTSQVLLGVVYILYLNVDFKRYFWDEVKREFFTVIMIRNFASLFNAQIMYYSLMYLSMFYINTIRNMAPLITTFLAWAHLNETIHWHEILGLFLSFFGVLLLVFNEIALSDSEATAEDSSTTRTVIFFLFLLCPIVASVVIINMRKYRNLNVYTTNIHVPYMFVIFFFLVWLVTWNWDFSFIGTITPLQWLFFGLQAILYAISIFSMNMAFQNAKLSSMMILQYLPVITGCLFDFFIFDIRFSNLELFAISLVFVANLGSTLVTILKGEKKKERVLDSQKLIEREEKP